MYNKAELTEELNNIDMTYDFSEDCDVELKNYILRHNLAYYDDDDIVFLSASGENFLGLSDRGTGDEEDITESFYNESGNEDEY